jgi:hypothetical protein
VARCKVVAPRADNYAAAPGNSFAPMADNFSPVATHNSAAAGIDNCAAAGIDNCAAQNNCAPAGADIEAGLEADWAFLANGWVPDEKDEAGDRYDDFDFAQRTAPQPKPAS